VGLLVGAAEHTREELRRTHSSLSLCASVCVCVRASCACAACASLTQTRVALQEQTSIDYKIRKQLESRRKRGVVDDDIDDEELPEF